MQINVKLLTGIKIAFNIDSNDCIKDLKQKIQEQTKIPVERQKLSFSGKLLKNNNTISSYSIHDNSVIHLTLGHPGEIQVFVRDFSGINEPFEVTPTETIKDFWVQVEKKMAATPEACQFIYNGQFLNEDNTFQDYSIPEQSIIHIVFRRGV